MSIQLVTESTEITPGQWVCPNSLFADRICDRPRKVLKVSGQRVYLAEVDGRDFKNFISRKSVVYLCDTAEEALAVNAISDEQDEAIRSSTKAIKAAHRARIAALSGGGFA